MSLTHTRTHTKHLRPGRALQSKAGVLYVCGCGLAFALLLTLLLTTPTASAQTTCDVYNPSISVPTGYGASYNVFNTSEMMISILCNEDQSITVTSGNNDPLTYIYNQGYRYDAGAGNWVNFTYSCSGLIADAWCVGQVSKTLTNVPTSGTNFLVSYTCQWSGTKWNCGCSNTSCSTHSWQLQGWTVPSGGTIGEPGDVMNIDFENRSVGAYTEAMIVEDFNANNNDGSIRGPLGRTYIVSDPANSGRSMVLRVTHPAGEYAKGGASWKARFAPDNSNKSGSARYDDIYFAFDVYMPSNTKRMPYHKLPGLITGTLLQASHAAERPEPEGVLSFTATISTFTSLAFPNRPDGSMVVYYYDAEKTQKSDFFDTIDPTKESIAGSYVQPLGKWITIEQRVKLNTADSNDLYNPTFDKKNGLSEVWVNGKKMSSQTHLWRWTNTMKADGYWFLDYYNNTKLTSAPTTDQYLYYDNMRVSTDPITH